MSVPSPLWFEALGSFVAIRNPNDGRRAASGTMRNFVASTTSASAAV